MGRGVNTIIFLGILSAYALWPTLGTIAYRQDLGQIPQDISMYDALIAVDDCNLIGHEATIYSGDREFSALVMDCAGSDSAEYLSDGDDLTTPFKISAEVSYHFWKAHPDVVQTLVTVEVVR